MSNDPWVVPVPKTACPRLPVGSYPAQFLGVFDVKFASGTEEKWRFVWQVVAGEFQGQLATTVCDKNLNPAALGGVLVSGLLGRPLLAGERVQALVDSCVGKHYTVVVQLGPKGGREAVRMVLPMQTNP